MLTLLVLHKHSSCFATATVLYTNIVTFSTHCCDLLAHCLQSVLTLISAQTLGVCMHTIAFCVNVAVSHADCVLSLLCPEKQHCILNVALFSTDVVAVTVLSSAQMLLLSVLMLLCSTHTLAVGDMTA